MWLVGPDSTVCGVHETIEEHVDTVRWLPIRGVDVNDRGVWLQDPLCVAAFYY